MDGSLGDSYCLSSKLREGLCKKGGVSRGGSKGAECLEKKACCANKAQLWRRFCETDRDENKTIEDVSLGGNGGVEKDKESIWGCQTCVTNCFSLFLPGSNSLQMIFSIKCCLLLFITLWFIYTFIFWRLLGTRHYYIYFMVQFMDTLNL